MATVLHPYNPLKGTLLLYTVISSATRNPEHCGGHEIIQISHFVRNDKRRNRGGRYSKTYLHLGYDSSGMSHVLHLTTHCLSGQRVGVGPPEEVAS